MRKAILGAIVALLLVGAYASYVVSYPKYPKVEGCVNPFAVVKPVSRVQENWSRVHVFFKLVTSRDFWKLAKPWNVDYSHVKVVKHTLKYKGENITMLAMGIPLRDRKHVAVLYEFSDPVRGIKTEGFLIKMVDNVTAKTIAVTTNGVVSTTDICPHECNSDFDCTITHYCHEFCCKVNTEKAIQCCSWCIFTCVNPFLCIVCLEVECPWCVQNNCLEFGSECKGGWVLGP